MTKVLEMYKYSLQHKAIHFQSANRKNITLSCHVISNQEANNWISLRLMKLLHSQSSPQKNKWRQQDRKISQAEWRFVTTYGDRQIISVFLWTLTKGIFIILKQSNVLWSYYLLTEVGDTVKKNHITRNTTLTSFCLFPVSF